MRKFADALWLSCCLSRFGFPGYECFRKAFVACNAGYNVFKPRGVVLRSSRESVRQSFSFLRSLPSGENFLKRLYMLLKCILVADLPLGFPLMQ